MINETDPDVTFTISNAGVEAKAHTAAGRRWLETVKHNPFHISQLESHLNAVRMAGMKAEIGGGVW